MSTPFGENIQIRAEVDRADIHTCHFTIDRPVHSGAASFASAAEAQSNELAEKLFRIPGIAKVALDGYKVSVTQSDNEDWRQLGKRIGSAIRMFFFGEQWQFCPRKFSSTESGQPLALRAHLLSWRARSR